MTASRLPEESLSGIVLGIDMNLKRSRHGISHLLLGAISAGALLLALPQASAQMDTPADQQRHRINLSDVELTDLIISSLMIYLSV